MLYPRYMAASLALIFLDIFSHWFQMYATLLVGAATHKVMISSDRAGAASLGGPPSR